jgi:hypothetical protein
MYLRFPTLPSILRCGLSANYHLRAFHHIGYSTLTARIKRQGALRAQVEKEKMRANLLRAISHDLRTPLTTIHGSCCALLDTQETLSPKQRRELLLGICQDSEWLIRLVENLLSVTRITDTQSVRLHKTPEAAEEVLESACTKFAKRYPGIALSVQMPPQVLILPMDAVLIEQTVSNLLENAVLHAKARQPFPFASSSSIRKPFLRLPTTALALRRRCCPIFFPIISTVPTRTPRAPWASAFPYAGPSWKPTAARSARAMRRAAARYFALRCRWRNRHEE